MEGSHIIKGVVVLQVGEVGSNPNDGLCAAALKLVDFNL
jgi:hypothetical protein